MKSPQKPIPRVSPKKASKGFQWPKRSAVRRVPWMMCRTCHKKGTPSPRSVLKCAKHPVGGVGECGQCRKRRPLVTCHNYDFRAYAFRGRIKRKPRKPSETLRIYGGKKRIEFVKSLPCAACGVEGFSDNAHVLGNGGMSRKADYTTIAPLCGGFGCHLLYDDGRWNFDASFPDFNPEKAAAETQAAWIAHSQEKA